MHTFIGTVEFLFGSVRGKHKVLGRGELERHKAGNPKRHFAGHSLLQFGIPAYPMERSQMRPVTKITIFGFRLAIVVLAVYWFCIFVGTHLPNTGEIVDLRFGANDKVKHFCAFFLLGGLLCYVTNSPRWWKRFAIIGLVGMAYAAIDEITQNFIPGRYPDILDFVADAAGLWTAIAVYVGAKCIHLVLRKQPPDEKLA